MWSFRANIFGGGGGVTQPKLFSPACCWIVFVLKILIFFADYSHHAFVSDGSYCGKIQFPIPNCIHRLVRGKQLPVCCWISRCFSKLWDCPFVLVWILEITFLPLKLHRTPSMWLLTMTQEIIAVQAEKSARTASKVKFDFVAEGIVNKKRETKYINLVHFRKWWMQPHLSSQLQGLTRSTTANSIPKS